jgi:CGNR zinc finger
MSLAAHWRHDYLWYAACMNLNPDTPWWLRPPPVAAQTPECRAAVDELRTHIGALLAGAGEAVSFRNDAPPGCLRVRIGGVEIDIAFRPTGRTERSCENPTCRKVFWAEDASNAAVTRFCSHRCGNLEAVRRLKDRRRGQPVQALPRVISRVLADAGEQRAEGKDGPGFTAKAADGGTEVRGEPDVLARAAKVLEGLGYGVQRRSGSLLVTERKGAQA